MQGFIASVFMHSLKIHILKKKYRLAAYITELSVVKTVPRLSALVWLYQHLPCGKLHMASR